MNHFIDQIRSRRVNGKYSIVEKLGQGGFGMVYLGKHFGTGMEVALKMEHRDSMPSVLAEEYEVYTCVQGELGFPAVEWYGWQDDYKIMVLELLGPNLEDLFAFCERRFSLKTTLMILDQLLRRFEVLHSRKIVHRDVKPQNFLMGCGKQGNIIYMTDFGLAHETQLYNVQHDDRPRQPRLIGTARFASVRGHAGEEQSPWDDLESLGYMAAYFLQGQLPWQGLKASEVEDKNSTIMEAKKNFITRCTGLPRELLTYMRFVTTAEHGQSPDYGMLREFFTNIAQSEGIEYDDVYDWTIRLCL